MDKVIETYYTKYCMTNAEAAEEFFGDEEFYSSEGTCFWTGHKEIIVTEVICGQLHRVEVLIGV